MANSFLAWDSDSLADMITPVTRPSQQLMDNIRSGEFILMDGALGTELEKRDVPIEGTAWSATAVRTSADTIREIHSDYIDAGAQIHIVNSFALARHVLQPVGLAGEFEVLNRLAVSHFNQAVAETVASATD